jgi:cytochrome oxidase Cu insertion factor (SCO1/SenC/PrrC family)
MRSRLSRWLGAAVVAAACAAGAAAATDTADLDRPVKNFTLKDLMGGKEVSLSQFKGKTVVLSFISYHCDTTWRYEKRMGKLIGDYGRKGVVFLNVNSNANDTPEGIKKYVEARNLTIPLLKDTGNRVADYFNTQVTPTFYVLDKEGVLRYRGSYDDNREENSAKKQYVTPALDAVMASRPVTTKEHRAFG